MKNESKVGGKRARATYAMPEEQLVLDERVPIDDAGEQYQPRKHGKPVRYTPRTRKEKR